MFRLVNAFWMVCMVAWMTAPVGLAATASTLTLSASTGLSGGCSAITFNGKLTRVGTGNAIANAPIELYLNNQKIGEAMTGANGTYSFQYAYSEQLIAGRHSITAKFPGNGLFRASTVYNTHTNSRGNPTMIVQNKTVNSGSDVDLVASMTNCSQAAIANRIVTFYYNGRLMGSARTNASGVATLRVRAQTKGNIVVRADFGGDNYYNAAMKIGSITVR
jgi:hypothetical protein